MHVKRRIHGYECVFSLPAVASFLPVMAGYKVLQSMRMKSKRPLSPGRLLALNSLPDNHYGGDEAGRRKWRYKNSGDVSGVDPSFPEVLCEYVRTQTRDIHQQKRGDS
jgi:hypothetical protein